MYGFKQAVYYYANGKAIKCDYDENVLEERDQQLIKLPNEPYHDMTFLGIDKVEYFVTYKIAIDGQLRFFSNVIGDLVEFNGFNVRVVLPIADYQPDRNFNKVTVGNNQLFITNGIEVFKAKFGPNYLNDSYDVRYEKVFTNEGTGGRLYNLCGKLVVRNAGTGVWHVRDDYDQFV